MHCLRKANYKLASQKNLFFSLVSCDPCVVLNKLCLEAFLNGSVVKKQKNNVGICMRLVCTICKQDVASKSPIESKSVCESSSNVINYVLCQCANRRQLNIKFCYKVTKTERETRALITQLYWTEAIRRKCVYAYIIKSKLLNTYSIAPLISKTPDDIEQQWTTMAWDGHLFLYLQSFQNFATRSQEFPGIPLLYGF